MLRWCRSASTSACSSTVCRYKSASRSALSRCLLRSGNGSMSGKANESAVKKGLLFRPASRAEIMRAGAEHAEVTVEQVVRELKLIGFSDIRKVVSWRNELVTRTEKGKDGEPVTVLMPRVTIIDADKISDEAAAAVAEVSQTVNGAREASRQ